ncbi:AMMECR1 domain-containing protein [Aphelenchoides bicaudatus]|nr:AMMECR1 domain-containing protein [Aphelenchoides bicaudatus]
MASISIDMPFYCFDILLSRLHKKPQPPIPRSIPDRCFPLFVTWKKGQEEHLRGCIGTFNTNLSLHKGLPEYATISAFEDSRFDPISLNEVPQLSCGVSLLVKFEPARDYTDWIVGVHGIHIYFSQNGRQMTAVFLPEVASEHGWDHIETMNRLMQKGGFRGHISESDRKSARVERFQSEKMTVTYQDYIIHKRQDPDNPTLPN